MAVTKSEEEFNNVYKLFLSDTKDIKSISNFICYFNDNYLEIRSNWNMEIRNKPYLLFNTYNIVEAFIKHIQRTFNKSSQRFDQLLKLLFDSFISKTIISSNYKKNQSYTKYKKLMESCYNIYKISAVSKSLIED